MNVIRFNNVKKAYGAIQALRGVSFEVAAGEIVALLGPNGAGKTTAIEILLGLRHPDSGDVLIDGKAPHSLLARSQMAATPQNTGFPDALTVREIVAFAAGHYPTPRDVDATLAAFELNDLAGKRLGGLSGGQQRRVALALAFVANTPLVLRDEPSTGLDVESRRRLWEQLLASVDAKRTVVFTTHYVEDAAALATRLVVIDRGELRFDGTPAAFRDTFGSRRVEYLAPGGERVVATPLDTDAYVRELVLAEVAFRDLHVTQSSFEDIFLELTGAAS